jgi:hypothetical protein
MASPRLRAIAPSLAVILFASCSPVCSGVQPGARPAGGHGDFLERSALPSGTLLDTLHALGIASLDQDAAHYGLALALGSGELELRELGFAYVALARGAVHLAVRAIRFSVR